MVTKFSLELKEGWVLFNYFKFKIVYNQILIANIFKNLIFTSAN